MQRMKKKEIKGEKDEGRNITLGWEIEVEKGEGGMKIRTIVFYPIRVLGNIPQISNCKLKSLNRKETGKLPGLLAAS